MNIPVTHSQRAGVILAEYDALVRRIERCANCDRQTAERALNRIFAVGISIDQSWRGPYLLLDLAIGLLGRFELADVLSAIETPSGRSLIRSTAE